MHIANNSNIILPNQGAITAFGAIPKKILFLVSCFLMLGSMGMTQSPTKAKQITVAQNGTSDFKTIQEAINSVPLFNTEHIVIYIKKGIYHEKIIVPASVSNISIIGEDKDATIITNDDYAGKFMHADTTINKTKFGTSNSYTLCIHGNDVTLENLTVKNAAGKVGQAVALDVDGDRFIAKNCNLLGNQDTLLTANEHSRQYYLDCLIEGTTDFIFGGATAVFKACTLRSLANSYITAASTSQQQKFGYVFFDCKLVANEETKMVYLGRPWRPYANVIFIGCEVGKHIRPEGWHNWGKTENESTAFYGEYGNKGEGAQTTSRVKWSKQLTQEEAAKYTMDNIFQEWKPQP